jgi:hypothetical protein
MTNNQPDDQNPKTEIDQSQLAIAEAKTQAKGFIEILKNPFLANVVKFLPVGGSGFAFVSFLFKQEWFLAIITFPATLIAVAWIAWSDSVLIRVYEIFKEKGTKDVNLFMAWQQNLNEAIKWQLAGIEDKYLKLQGNTCKDFTTEGYKPGSSIFVPLLNEVFVPLDLSNNFLRNLEGESLPLQQGFKWDTKTRDLLEKEGLRIWDILKQSNKISAYKRLAVLAWGGYGKTTLLRHITYIYTHKKEKDAKYKAPKLLPVLLLLRTWQETIVTVDDLDLPTLIEKYHIPKLPESDGLILPPNWAKNHLRNGNFLVMFDGFDEVKIEWRFKVSQWLGQEMNNYQQTIFILTSRPSGYKDFITEYKLKAELFVKPFNPDQQEKFIHNWYWCQERYARGGRNTPDVKAEAVKNANNLVQQLRERPELDDLAKNPLLLNMITNLHRSYTGEELPKRRGELYREVVNLQLGNRPLAKQINLLLPADESQQVLQDLALFMVQENKSALEYHLLVNQLENPVKSFDSSIDIHEFIKQIVNVSELLVKRDEDYQFAHLSFQGYLAGREIIDTKQEHLLIDNWQNSWWRETILLYCAQTNPNRFLQQLIDIGTEEAVKLAYDCIKETPRKIDPNIEKQLPELEQKVSNLLFQKLEEYLKNGQYQEADQETTKLMLQIGDTESKGYLNIDNIKAFPVDDLRTIDQLWLKYSNHKFGFSVQKQIWLDCGGKLDDNYDYETFKKFSDRIGWRKNGSFINYPDDYTFNTNALQGHLPVCVGGLGVGGGLLFSLIIFIIM